MQRVRGCRLAVAAGIALAIGQASCEPMTAAQDATATVPRGVALPWPLPSPSTSMEIPLDLHAPARPGAHLDAAADWLSTALQATGYRDLSYYDVPGGFVVMGGLELVDDQGLGLTPSDQALRFSGKLPEGQFLTAEFWSQLLAQRKGRYRLMLFVVIDEPFGYSTDVTDGHILWRQPSRKLPRIRALMPYDGQEKWYALIYEFEKTAGTPSAKLASEPVDPAVNLAKSGILAALEREAKGK